MPKSTDRKTRGPTRRGRLQIQFRAVPAEELAPNPNNQLTTQDPVQRRHELLDGLAAALANLKQEAHAPRLLGKIRSKQWKRSRAAQPPQEPGE